MVVASIYSMISTSLQAITPANVSNPIEFWLAFLLLMAILSTVLKNVGFFKDPQNKAARGLVAMIIAYFAVTVAWVNPVLVYMSSTLGVTALILVAILIVTALAGVDMKSKAGSYITWGIFAFALIILFLGGGVFSYFLLPSSVVPSSGFSLSSIYAYLPDIIAAAIILGFVAFVVYMLVGGGGSSSNPPAGKTP